MNEFLNSKKIKIPSFVIPILLLVAMPINMLATDIYVKIINKGLSCCNLDFSWSISELDSFKKLDEFLITFSSRSKGVIIPDLMKE